VLQRLLAKFPDLLAGDQVTSGEARRWILIDRESAVPDSEDGGGRWSVDHLFLDQDAVPTLVEVKRSSDTRIRREVVGQLIDYAANAVVYCRSTRCGPPLSAGWSGRILTPTPSLPRSWGLTPTPRVTGSKRPQISKLGESGSSSSRMRSRASCDASSSS
jgi:hypothetical protein